MGHVTRMGNMINGYILVWKPRGERKFGRPRKYDIQKKLLEIWLEGVDWIHVDQGKQWTFARPKSTSLSHTKHILCFFP